MPKHAIGTLVFDQQMRRRTAEIRISASLGPALVTRCTVTRVMTDRGVKRLLTELSATPGVIHAEWVDDRRLVSTDIETYLSVVADDELLNARRLKWGDGAEPLD